MNFHPTRWEDMPPVARRRGAQGPARPRLVRRDGHRDAGRQGPVGPAPARLNSLEEETMLPTSRRIVTVNDDAGKSRILLDGPSPHVAQSGPARGLINLWATEAGGPDLATADGAARARRHRPPPGHAQVGDTRLHHAAEGPGAAVARLRRDGPPAVRRGDPEGHQPRLDQPDGRAGAADGRADRRAWRRGKAKAHEAAPDPRHPLCCRPRRRHASVRSGASA